ncbi:ATP-binding cassette domain-containing protein [Microbacterium sp. NPDC056234]|uniref:ABC transporter ATP-binding protein n=1 Tax=Microbacterium sp. NPDC056234 TaxID=3345757 RepID=UPI0035E31B9D
MTSGALTATAVGVSIDEQMLLPTTSATITAGSALAIRGPNGSGKTTLLRVLAGSVRPSTGEVHWEGEPLRIRRADHRAVIAAMIGMPAMARDLTLVEQLRFVRATWGDSASEGERTALEGLAELGISALAARYPTELSSGQLQLFSLALTFARPCRVLLLDEPEQRLDAHRRSLVADALRRRMAAGCGIGLATHSGRLARAIGADVLTVGEAP